jgi:hypothetical protein
MLSPSSGLKMEKVCFDSHISHLLPLTQAKIILMAVYLLFCSHSYFATNSCLMNCVPSGVTITAQVMERNPHAQKYNKKFWKELICLLSLNYLKMSFALKPAFAPA